MQDELRVAATTQNVRLVCGFVRDAAERSRLTEDALFDVDLAVEEASINIVRHAYGPDQSGDIGVQVEATDSEIRVMLTDWGRPFDADAAYPAADVPVEARAQGGMGLLLIYESMDEVTRTTASGFGGPNVLTMVKHAGS